MLKRNLALVALAIALIANVTALAGTKQALSYMKMEKAKANAMSEIKAIANNQHPGPHIAKPQGGWRNSEKTHVHPGGGPPHLNNPPEFNLAKKDAKDQSSMKLSAEKNGKSFKDGKHDKNC